MRSKPFRLLDFGCGRGTDVQFYRELGIDAAGWDPYPPFGYAKRPVGIFDIVTCVFVLNVIPNPSARLKALNDAMSFASDSGRVVVATRSPESIVSEAESKSWPKHNDGYWSSEARGTFQKGIGLDEIDRLANFLGWDLTPETDSYPHTRDMVLAILRKKS